MQLAGNGIPLMIAGAIMFGIGMALIFGGSPAGGVLAVIGGFLFGLGFDAHRRRRP